MNVIIYEQLLQASYFLVREFTRGPVTFWNIIKQF